MVEHAAADAVARFEHDHRRPAASSARAAASPAKPAPTTTTSTYSSRLAHFQAFRPHCRRGRPQTPAERRTCTASCSVRSRSAPPAPCRRRAGPPRRTPPPHPRRSARGCTPAARRAAVADRARPPGPPRVVRTRGRAREPHQRQVGSLPRRLRVLLAVGPVPHRRRRVRVPRHRRDPRSGPRNARRRRDPVLHRRRRARARRAAPAAA